MMKGSNAAACCKRCATMAPRTGNRAGSVGRDSAAISLRFLPNGI